MKEDLSEYNEYIKGKFNRMVEELTVEDLKRIECILDSRSLVREHSTSPDMDIPCEGCTAPDIEFIDGSPFEWEDDIND